MQSNQLFEQAIKNLLHKPETPVDIRCKDIQKIQNMVKIIQDYEEQHADPCPSTHLITSLKQIASHAYLSFNDKDKNNIRNRHGYIQRCNDNVINPEGVYFEKIYHLLAILNQDGFALTEAESAILRKGIMDLKYKLREILTAEQEFMQERQLGDVPQWLEANLHGGALLQLVKWSKQHYLPLVLNRTEQEFKELETIDFACREERYSFGRALTLAGELMHEVMEDHNGQNLTTLEGIFNEINKLRDKLVHGHRVIFRGTNVQTTQATVESLIGLLAKISVVKEDEMELGNVLNVLNAFKSILANKTPKTVTPQSAIVPEKPKDKQLTGKIRESIIAAIGCIDLIAQNKKTKKTKNPPQQLQKLNSNYQQLLTQLSEQERTAYPPVLIANDKDRLIAFRDGLSVQSDERKQQQQVISKQAIATRKISTIDSLLKKIQRELDYYGQIECNNMIPSNQKTAILHHSGMIIGVYAEDILKCSKDQPLLKSQFSQTLTTGMGEAIRQRKDGLSHNVLALNQEQFDNTMRQHVRPAQADFLAVQTLFTHQSNPAPLQKATILYNVGQALVRLCRYSEATDYFKRALEDLSKTTHVSHDAIHPRTNADQYILDSMGITQPYAILIDLPRTMLGVDAYQLEFTNGWAYAYIRSGQLAEAHALLKNFIKTELVQEYRAALGFMSHNQNPERILELQKNFPRVCSVYQGMMNRVGETQAPFVIHIPEEQDIFDEIAKSLSMLAEIYFMRGKEDKALSLFDRAFAIAATIPTQVSISLNIANCLTQLHFPERAQTIIQRALELEELDPIQEFNCLQQLCVFKLGDNNIDIVQELSSMKNIVLNKMGDIKGQKGDRYPIYLLQYIELHIRLLMQKKDSFSKLQKRISQGEKIAGSLSTAGEVFPESATFYFLAVRAVSRLISTTQAIPEWQTILQEAQRLFNVLLSSSGLSDDERVSAAKDLATAYSNATHKNLEVNDKRVLEYLERCLALQKQFNIPTEATGHNIACYHFSSAEIFLQKRQQEKALLRFNEAIKILEPIKDSYPPAFLELASSHERIGDIKANPKQLEIANGCYTDYLKHFPKDEEAKTYFLQCLQKRRIYTNMEDAVRTAYTNRPQRSVASKFLYVPKQGLDAKLFQDYCTKHLGCNHVGEERGCFKIAFRGIFKERVEVLAGKIPQKLGVMAL